MPTAGPDQPENVAYDNSTSTLNAGCELSSLFASRPMSGRMRPSVCQPVIVLCSLFTLATADYADQHRFFIFNAGLSTSTIRRRIGSEGGLWARVAFQTCESKERRCE